MAVKDAYMFGSEPGLAAQPLTGAQRFFEDISFLEAISGDGEHAGG